MNIHTLDATNQSIGRLASQIAVILRGKIRPNYQPNIEPQEQVTVKNITKAKFTGNKLDGKKYYHYSRYPSGMKKRNLGDQFTKDPAWVLKHAVYSMLAPNKIRDKIIKNLIIK